MDIQTNARELPAHASSRVAPAAGDLRLSLRLSNLVGRVVSFYRELDQTRTKLQPLDDLVGHETELEEAQLTALGFDPCWDEVRTAIGLAHSDLKHAVGHAENAHAHIKGLLRGSLKHEYEELLARRVRANQDTLEKWERFQESYRPPSTPFAIRQVALSALVEGCEDVAKRTEDFWKEHGDAGADFIAEIRQCARRLAKLKSVLAKLRDNPSQKMTQPLQPCVDLALAVYESLSTVMECAKVRSGRPY